MNLPEIEYSEEAKKAESKRSKLLEINKEAAKYFYFQLRARQGEIGYRYLRDRQLSDETIKKFGLGFANKTSNDLVQYLRSKGYPPELGLPLQQHKLPEVPSNCIFHHKSHIPDI